MFLIVHNPLSSNKKSRKTTKKYVRFFKKNNIPFIVRSTLKIDDLNEFLAKRENITDILLLGGDGSINFLINNVNLNIISQRIHLAKSGSGNDFLRSLKAKQKADVTIGQALLNKKTPIKFINGCGLGFDGLVCHYVNNDDKKNKISYFINVFKALMEYNYQDITVTIDGKKRVYHRAFIAAIQNGRYFGGGMKASPKADIEDDDFYVIIVHNINKLLLQILLLSIYSGLHRIFKKRVSILKGKEIQVDFNESVYFQADGEVQTDVTSINVSALEKRELYAFNKKNHK